MCKQQYCRLPRPYVWPPYTRWECGAITHGPSAEWRHRWQHVKWRWRVLMQDLDNLIYQALGR